MRSEILDWVTAALQGINLSVEPITATNAHGIVETAKKIFVVGNPRAWWMSAKGSQELYE
jgi:hypothetical protein